MRSLNSRLPTAEFAENAEKAPLRKLCVLSVLCGFFAFSALPESALGQTSYPMITHAHPVAVQRGQTTEITVEGQQNFSSAYKVLIEGEDVVAEVVGEPPQPSDESTQKAKKPRSRQRLPRSSRVKIKITPEADAMPGVREFRIATARGISSIGQIAIVDEPVVLEATGNNTRDQAESVPVPSVACGKIEAAEDVDYYKFRAEAGRTLTFEIHSARLQDKIHDLQKHADPMLTLLDGSGRELAGNDDFYFADPMFNFHFEKAGEYWLQVRDSKYDGDPRWVYALTITNKPYVSHAFPLAVRPGNPVEIEPVGSARQLRQKFKLTIPSSAAPGLFSLQADLGGVRTNHFALLVSSLPQSLEKEPNDVHDQASRITIPGCINGRISGRRDLDYYQFSGKKGEPIRFQVQARRFGTDLRSGLDASLDILDAKGRVLASGDDISPAVKDASVVFTPPADGDYVLRVRDLLGKGGEHFIYAVEAEHAEPDFTLRCDGDKAMIGPGSSTAWYVHVTRLHGFAGPVKITIKGLPKGVNANPLTIPPTMIQGVVVLSAAGDAPIDAANVEVVGTTALKGRDGKEHALVRAATVNQEIYLPGGGRGRFDVNMQTVAVTERSDIERVEVTPPTITLKPGQEMKLNVKVHRHASFAGDVQLDVKLRHLNSVFGDPLPPGVMLVEEKSKTLLGKGSEGHIVLRAAPDAAPIDNVPISILAQVSINFVVKISYSSQAIRLSLVK